MTSELVTAVSAVIGAVAVLISSVGGFVVTLRTKDAVDVVHKVVNSRATEQDDRIAQLTASLTKAGVIVPDKNV